jgi:hypothetical protein
LVESLARFQRVYPWKSARRVADSALSARSQIQTSVAPDIGLAPAWRMLAGHSSRKLPFRREIGAGSDRHRAGWVGMPPQRDGYSPIGR